MSVSADLDEIFVEIGEFGPHQMVTILLLCVLNILSGASAVNYIISANTLDYRCKVPECESGENNRDLSYNQPWLKNAIPMENGKVNRCYRFAPKNKTITEPSNQCTADLFDSTTKIACTEYIYASHEMNMQTEFNINCLDSYKLALVGSIGNIARFIFLPFSGFLSDSYGRKSGIIFGTQLAFIFAVAKSFSTNYYMYIVLEFLEAATFSFCFSGIYVFAIELLGAKYRVLGSALLSTAFSIGEILVGVVAMNIHNFRDVIRIFSVPGLFVFTYFWLIPESFRWLLVANHVDQAIKILKKIAKFNGRKLSDKNVETIKMKYSFTSATKNHSTAKDAIPENQSVLQLLWTVLRSKRLCLRFLSCCFQWATCCFSYYGLSQSSTQIAGSNRYLSFIIVSAIEVPSGLLSQPLLKRMKRRVLLFCAFLSTALTIIVTPFIPETYSWAILLCFVLGKGSINLAFLTIYIHTAEQFSTSIRNTVMNTCSMIGRVGSIVAPFVVILGSQYSNSLQAILFSGSAILAAILLIFNAETFNKKLPDSIEEAKNL